MTAALAGERFEFAPPPGQGWLRGLAIALLAHACLLAALSLGVQWKTHAPTLSAEAELWSATPQTAAPPAAEPPPEAPTPVVKPAPPQVAPPTPKIQPAPVKADIVLTKEKLRIKKEKLAALEAQTQARLKLEQTEKLKANQQAKAKAQADANKKNTQDAKRKAALKAEQDNLETQKIEMQREANLKRINGLAGATGSAQDKGSALQSSGPSSGYAGKVSARIKANVLLLNEIAGNPTAEIEVRTSPDGTIIGRKLLKSSGVKNWDEAALRAIDKTDSLPRDTDGRVPNPIIVNLRPKD